MISEHELIALLKKAVGAESTEKCSEHQGLVIAMNDIKNNQQVQCDKIDDIQEVQSEINEKVGNISTTLLTMKTEKETEAKLKRDMKPGTIIGIATIAATLLGHAIDAIPKVFGVLITWLKKP